MAPMGCCSNLAMRTTYAAHSAGSCRNRSCCRPCARASRRCARSRTTSAHCATGTRVTLPLDSRRPDAPSHLPPRPSSSRMGRQTKRRSPSGLSLPATSRPIHWLWSTTTRANEPNGALAELMERIVYLPTESNLGFSGGMNLGIAHALNDGAAAVALVNNDVYVPPDCLPPLVQRLSGSPETGVVGPVIVARARPDRVASRGMSYASTSGRMRQVGFGDDVTGDRSDTPVDGVNGCLMVIKRAVFEKVGLFDEAYFFGFEDLDFCLRARRAGFTCVVVGAATAHHEGSLAIGAQSTDRLYYAARNHLRVANRANRFGWGLSAFRGASIVSLNLAHAARCSGGSLAARLWAVGQGTLDYLRGRVGRRGAKIADLGREHR